MHQLPQKSVSTCTPNRIMLTSMKTIIFIFGVSEYAIIVFITDLLCSYLDILGILQKDLNKNKCWWRCLGYGLLLCVLCHGCSMQILPYILESNLHPNLIRTPFLPPCIVRTAHTPALSFGQTPALDRESNPHSILICICPFSPLQL
jgi:hypothetical protein